MATADPPARTELPGIPPRRRGWPSRAQAELARDADPEPAGPTGRSVVYTLHFDPPYRPSPDAPPYKTAGHYTGWAANLEKRLAEHEAGRGARLTQVQVEAGGTWRVAAVEPGTRFRERQLKAHSAGRRCPICKAEAQAEPEAGAGRA